jgi:hypothetical protein
MIPSFLALSRLSFAAIAVGSFVLIACQNTGFGTNPAALGALPKNAARLSPASAPTYTWQPYNISGADNTLVTGISSDNNNIRFVAATYPNAGSPYKSFIADVSGSITTGGPVDEPPSHKPPDVYLAAVADDVDGVNNYSAGYLGPGSSGNCQSTTLVVACGFVYDPAAGSKYELVDPKQGTHACAQTYLYGTSDPHIQVGYYTTGDANTSSACVEHAVEEYSYPSGCGSPPCAQFVDFQFPSSFGTVTNSKAYGMNNYGEVVGSFTAQATGTLEIGWEFRDFIYRILQYQLQPNTGSTPAPLASPTEPRDISWSGSIVGSYKDSGGATHGFLRYYKDGMWYAENCCNSSSSMRTVVYGTDDAAYLVGAYKTTANGAWNGFIATCSSSC